MIDGEIQPSYIKPEHILTTTDNGNGYKLIGLVKEGVRKNYYVHRLVAEAFIPNPEHKTQVNHKNYLRSDNRVNNLEWCTSKENNIYSVCNRPARRNGKRASTGYRFIGKRGNRFRVCIGKPRIDKYFNTLEEALEWRNIYMKEKGIVLIDE